MSATKVAPKPGKNGKVSRIQADMKRQQTAVKNRLEARLAKTVAQATVSENLVGNVIAKRASRREEVMSEIRKAARRKSAIHREFARQEENAMDAHKAHVREQEKAQSQKRSKLQERLAAKRSAVAAKKMLNAGIFDENAETEQENNIIDPSLLKPNRKSKARKVLKPTVDVEAHVANVANPEMTAELPKFLNSKNYAFLVTSGYVAAIEHGTVLNTFLIPKSVSSVSLLLRVETNSMCVHYYANQQEFARSSKTITSVGAGTMEAFAAFTGEPQAESQFLRSRYICINQNHMETTGQLLIDPAMSDPIQWRDRKGTRVVMAKESESVRPSYVPFKTSRNGKWNALSTSSHLESFGGWDKNISFDGVEYKILTANISNSSVIGLKKRTQRRYALTIWFILVLALFGLMVGAVYLLFPEMEDALRSIVNSSTSTAAGNESNTGSENGSERDDVVAPSPLNELSFDLSKDPIDLRWECVQAPLRSDTGVPFESVEAMANHLCYGSIMAPSTIDSEEEIIFGAVEGMRTHDYLDDDIFKLLTLAHSALEAKSTGQNVLMSLADRAATALEASLRGFAPNSDLSCPNGCYTLEQQARIASIITAAVLDPVHKSTQNASEILQVYNVLGKTSASIVTTITNYRRHSHLHFGEVYRIFMERQIQAIAISALSHASTSWINTKHKVAQVLSAWFDGYATYAINAQQQGVLPAYISIDQAKSLIQAASEGLFAGSAAMAALIPESDLAVEVNSDMYDQLLAFVELLVENIVDSLSTLKLENNNINSVQRFNSIIAAAGNGIIKGTMSKQFWSVVGKPRSNVEILASLLHNVLGKVVSISSRRVMQRSSDNSMYSLTTYQELSNPEASGRNVNNLHGELTLQMISTLSMTTFINIESTNELYIIYAKALSGLLSGLPEEASSLPAGVWTSDAFHKSLKSVAYHFTNITLKTPSTRLISPLISRNDLKALFHKTAEATEHMLQGWSKTDRPYFVADEQALLHSHESLLKGFVTGLQNEEEKIEIISNVCMSIIENSLSYVGGSDRNSGTHACLTRNPSQFISKMLDTVLLTEASGQGINSQMSAEDLLTLNRELLHSVSVGVTSWNIGSQLYNYADVVLSEVVNHHTKSTTLRIISLNSNLDENDFGDIFSYAMQGQLEGLSGVVSSDELSAFEDFTKLFETSNQAWYQGLDGVSKLQSVDSAHELDTFILDTADEATEAACEKLQNNKNINNKWDPSSCANKAKESRAVVLKQFNNVLSQDVFQHWQGELCGGESSKCGNGVKECGEECDDANIRDGDGCSRTCLREIPCVAQLCDPIGTVGEWVQEMGIESGNAIVQSPVLPNMPEETSVDLVYSHGSSSSYALMITRNGMVGSYSLWKLQVNTVSRLFSSPELLYHTDSALSAVRIIGSSPLHGEFILLVDTGSCVLRKIELDAPFDASVFAGNGQCGFANGVGTAAQFNSPTDLQVIGSSQYSTAIIADKNNNCIRRVNLNTQEVSTYSGVCAEVSVTATNVLSKIVENWVASSVRYFQPQRIAIHADNQFAVVFCNYVYPNRQAEILALFQLHLISGVVKAGGHWSGKQIEPGSANNMIQPLEVIRSPDKYPPEKFMAVPHVGLLMDSVGENMYFSVNSVDETIVFLWKINEPQTEFLPVDWPLTTGTIVKSNWYMSLSMAPDNQYLDMLNLNSTSITHIPVKRPAGPWGAQKKCLVNGKCSCLAGFSGDLCNGDQCPNDPEKKIPGICGCGKKDVNENGVKIADTSSCSF